MSTVLDVQNLSVAFDGKTVTHKVSFSIPKGKTLALVGESGSGKTVSALSILKLLPYPRASHPSGKILFHGEDLLTVSDHRLRDIRGDKISMIFQEPMTSLNPLHTVEKQILESIDLHLSLSKQDASQRIDELLELVGFDRIDERRKAFPHQLSGGQRQRVMIAMALAGGPELLIADEPTTALDVTTQAQILDLLKDLQKKLGMSILMITHDLNVVRKSGDDVCVMKDGNIVETGTTKQILEKPKHAYTKELIDSEPAGSPFAFKETAKPLLKCENIQVSFPIKTGFFQRVTDHFHAVKNISLSLKPGETLGIVGESGSGKSTLAFSILNLQKFSGDIVFKDQNLQGLSAKHMRPLRQNLQIVFQDPFGSLSPRMTVGGIVAEGLYIHGISQKDADLQVKNILKEVGLNPGDINRYPHEFSGGQRQRIAIARALVLKPDILILDEPTSALDRAVQADIIDLLRNLQKKHCLAYIFISHDLKVVQAMSHRVMVMKQGEVVEQGSTQDIFKKAKHPYTKELMAAAFG